MGVFDVHFRFQHICYSVLPFGENIGHVARTSFHLTSVFVMHNPIEKRDRKSIREGGFSLGQMMMFMIIGDNLYFLPLDKLSQSFTSHYRAPLLPHLVKGDRAPSPDTILANGWVWLGAASDGNYAPFLTTWIGPSNVQTPKRILTGELITRDVVAIGPKYLDYVYLEVTRERSFWTSQLTDTYWMWKSVGAYKIDTNRVEKAGDEEEWKVNWAKSKHQALVVNNEGRVGMQIHQSHLQGASNVPLRFQHVNVERDFSEFSFFNLDHTPFDLLVNRNRSRGQLLLHTAHPSPGHVPVRQ